MNVDPIASMRCWAIDIELDGCAYRIPPLAAADWWPVLTDGHFDAILDHVESDPDDPLNVDTLLLSGRVSIDELRQALTEAVEQAAGRTLHAATVLAAVANGQWAIVNGALATAGFRWENQPLGAALDAIHSVIVSRLEKEPLEKFLALLEGTRGRDRGRAIRDFEQVAGPRPDVTSVARYGGEPPRSRPRPRLHPRGAPSA